MENNLVLASDIGGTHITCAVVDISTWQILEHTISRSHVNSRQSAKSILHIWANTINQSINKSVATVTRLGFAVPGPFDYENGISLMNGQDKYDSLYQINVGKELGDYFPDHKQMCFINDAAAFLQGEVFAAKLEDRPAILGITLGTGLGSSVWHRNQKAFDADLWNTQYRDGIFEEYLATRWFTKRFYELSGFREEGFREILEKHKGTPAFEMLMTEYSLSFSDFLTHFANLHQCKTFILGGNIARAYDLISNYNKEKFAPFEIIVGQYAEKAAILGAASLYI
ncbi:ROK family protein [Sphingobacterium shayense]|uniref:ROK family protein n=1 Tax=Sphingobacterium shayense TaxID=626343 RepID=UPI001553D47F|nr:ROK family protein [Sphingobacterium shayense]NQD69862.1 ROK family protein [Sphingobacterium shayense]